MKTQTSTVIEFIIFDCWWLFTLILCCLIFYEMGMKSKKNQFEYLKQQVELLKIEKKKLQERENELKRRVASLNEPASIELLLRSKLGLADPDEIVFYLVP